MNKERKKERKKEKKKKKKKNLEATFQILSDPLSKLLKLFQVLRVGGIKLAGNLKFIKGTIEGIFSKVCLKEGLEKVILCDLFC